MHISAYPRRRTPETDAPPPLQRSTTPLLMALGLLLLGAVAAPPSYAQGVPDEFPGFSLADTAGQIHTLEDYAGQPKLVMFWATWCPYCKKLFPLIKQIHADHSAAGLAVIAISVRDDGDVAAYVEEYGLKMDVLLEGDALADSLGVPGTPAVLVVDADNQIIFATTNSDPDDPTLNRAALAVLQQP